MRSIHHGLARGRLSGGACSPLVAELNADRRRSTGSSSSSRCPAASTRTPSWTASTSPKDVDGLTAASAGLLAQGRPGPRPVHARRRDGAARARREPRSEGAEAVIVGRSILVGRPLSALLLNADATVTVCHSRTADLAQTCRRADILVAAVGSPRLVEGDWVKPGATVIDVGINRTDDGLVGDVDFDAASEVAGAITPVPGGRRPDDDRDAAARTRSRRRGPAPADRGRLSCRIRPGVRVEWARIRFPQRRKEPHWTSDQVPGAR